MATGKNIYHSVKLETPEIEQDYDSIAGVLPIYKNGVGNTTKIVNMDGTWEEREYTALYWVRRFTKFHGETETILAEIQEFLGRRRNYPVPIKETVLVPVKIREERVLGDGATGYVMLDQIQKVVHPRDIPNIDPNFFTVHPHAKSAILLRAKILIPSVQSYNKVMEYYRNSLSVHQLMQGKRKMIIAKRAKQMSEKSHVCKQPGLCAEKADDQPPYNDASPL